VYSINRCTLLDCLNTPVPYVLGQFCFSLCCYSQNLNLFLIVENGDALGETVGNLRVIYVGEEPRLVADPAAHPKTLPHLTIREFIMVRVFFRVSLCEEESSGAVKTPVSYVLAIVIADVRIELALSRLT
jgi:hypothetical protein